MSELVRPFRALRPTPGHAAKVIAPPYDVVSREEARAIARGRPYDFLHVSRPEIDFPDDVPANAESVYASAAATLERMRNDGILIREDRPCFYVYRLDSNGHAQTGVALTASIRAYEADVIKRHELTRPDKETDRVKNIESLNAETGPVLCAYRDTRSVDQVIADRTGSQPLFTVTGPHDVQHTIWRVDDTDAVTAMEEALDSLEALYIADGHHRSAAAARVANARRELPGGAAGADFFLAVAFPDTDLKILDYNRVVADLNGMTKSAFLSAVGKRFSIVESQRRCPPTAAKQFAMYLADQWYQLRLRDQAITSDPVEDLDISILQRALIEPLLSIHDPRTDSRIDFVGGIRGLAELEARVDSGQAAVAFALFPTSMAQLMAVADAGALMPPKSTWFEPKLADGLLTHVLD